MAAASNPYNSMIPAVDSSYAERCLSSESRLRHSVLTSFDRPNPHCNIIHIADDISLSDLLTAISREIHRARSDAAEQRLSDRHPSIIVIVRDDEDVEKLEHIARTSVNHPFHSLYQESSFLFNDIDKFGRKEEAIRFYNYRYRPILFKAEECGFIDFLKMPNLVLWTFGPSFGLSFFQHYNGVERITWMWRNDLDDWQVLCGIASLYSANSFHMPTWITDIIGTQYFGTEQWQRISSHAAHIHRRNVTRRNLSFVVFPLRADEVPEFHDRLLTERCIVKSTDRDVVNREPSVPGS